MRIGVSVGAAIVLGCLAATPAQGQTFRRAGAEFSSLRAVTLPAGKGLAIAVTQFYHHGELRGDGRNLAVFPKNLAKPVPSRLLQNGPGDFCRVAFQVAEGHGAYEILYGGEPLPADALPPWTADQGLLLETREFKNCNLNNYHVRARGLPVVKTHRQRLRRRSPSGRQTRLRSSAGPFLSRYSGLLRIATAGTYGFITSSQDCSFLVIDDKPVTEHFPECIHRAIRRLPGTRQGHRPSRPDRTSSSTITRLPASQAMMLLVWEINPGDAKAEAGELHPGRSHSPPPQSVDVDGRPGDHAQRKNSSPISCPALRGSVPLPDNEDAAGWRTSFLDTSPRALAGNSKYHWEFGDGQSSDRSSPDHVYLCPGLYAVKLTIRRGPRRPFEVDQSRLHRRAQGSPIRSKLPSARRLSPGPGQSYDARALDAADRSSNWCWRIQAKVDMRSSIRLKPHDQ